MKRAFTLIEIMIAMAIMVVVATAGIGVSLNTTRRKVLENEKEKLIETLKQARTNALAGKKDSGCTQTLGGWQVVTLGSSYVLNVVCGAVIPVSTVNLPSGISVSPADVMFIPVTGGTDLSSNLTITLTGNSNVTITVTDVGSVE